MIQRAKERQIKWQEQQERQAKWQQQQQEQQREDLGSETKSDKPAAGKKKNSSSTMQASFRELSIKMGIVMGLALLGLLVRLTWTFRRTNGVAFGVYVDDDSVMSMISSFVYPNITRCRWKPEPLPGFCDATQPTLESQKYETAEECEFACCQNPACVTFQFRTKEGCQWGGDTRLGSEKDGPASWCEPRPPASWKGQLVTKNLRFIPGACTSVSSDASAVDIPVWDPNELPGQCFGLGARVTTDRNTPEACMHSCCSQNEEVHLPVLNNNKEQLRRHYVVRCRIWQWREDAGCFNGRQEIHNCHDADPLALEKYTGKRKVQKSRTYYPPAYSGDYAGMTVT